MTASLAVNGMQTHRAPLQPRHSCNRKEAQQQRFHCKPLLHNLSTLSGWLNGSDPTCSRQVMFISCKFQDPASQAATRLNTIKIPSHSIAGKCTALTCKTVCNRYGRAMSKRSLHHPEIIALQNQGIVALLHIRAIDWGEAKEAQQG